MLGKLAVGCPNSFLLLEETMSLPSPAPLKLGVATVCDLAHGMSSEVTGSAFRSRHVKLPGNDHFPPSRNMQIIAIKYDRATRGKGSGPTSHGGELLAQEKHSFSFYLNEKFFLESF